MLKLVIDFLQKEWSSLVQAPLAFVIALTIGIAFGFLLAKLLYRERLAVLIERISLFEAKAADAASGGRVVDRDVLTGRNDDRVEKLLFIALPPKVESVGPDVLEAIASLASDSYEPNNVIARMTFRQGQRRPIIVPNAYWLESRWNRIDFALGETKEFTVAVLDESGLSTIFDKRTDYDTEPDLHSIGLGKGRWFVTVELIGDLAPEPFKQIVEYTLTADGGRLDLNLRDNSP